MRVLHITSHLNIGGITRYILTLSERLTSHGHRVIVASGGGHAQAQLAAMQIAYWRVPLHTSAECSLHVWQQASSKRFNDRFQKP